MNIDIQKHADDAIYQMQFDLTEAVKYVQRNARVDYKTALQAVQATLNFGQAH